MPPFIAERLEPQSFFLIGTWILLFVVQAVLALAAAAACAAALGFGRPGPSRVTMVAVRVAFALDVLVGGAMLVQYLPAGTVRMPSWFLYASSAASLVAGLLLVAVVLHALVKGHPGRLDTTLLAASAAVLAAGVPPELRLLAARVAVPTALATALLVAIRWHWMPPSSGGSPRL